MTEEPRGGFFDALARGGLGSTMRGRLAALLVVLGVVSVVGVLAVGTGFANDENAAKAKCSKATLDGTYLIAQDGVVISGKDQGPFAIAGKDT